VGARVVPAAGGRRISRPGDAGPPAVTGHYTTDPRTDQSLRHSLKDATAYSVMFGGGETYVSAFAIHLQASAAQIGWLASLPPLLGSMAQLASAWIGRLPGRRRAIMVAGARAQALLWLPLVALPLVFPAAALPLLIAVFTLYHGAGHFVAPQWSSLMGDLVPERRRGRFFARRTRYATITTLVAMLVAGACLHVFDRAGWTTAGFVAIFALAAVARAISAHHLGAMHDPAPEPPVAVRAPTRARWWRRMRGSPFARFAVFIALMQGATALASPFFAVYMLRDLHYSYLQFALNTAASALMQFITLNTWGRLSDTFGNRLILSITGRIVPALPVLWLVSDDFAYLVALQLLGGLAWGGFSLSSGNFLYDLVPRDRRARTMAIYNVATSGAVCAGALAGGYLAHVLPDHLALGDYTWSWGTTLFGVFLLSSVARAVVAAVFLPRLREVRVVRRASAADVVFRALRMVPLSGLVFDIVSAWTGERRTAPGQPRRNDVSAPGSRTK